MAKKKSNVKSVFVVCTAIVCLSLLEGLALWKGIDGTLFTIIVAAVAGLAGWSMPQLEIIKP